MEVKNIDLIDMKKGKEVDMIIGIIVVTHIDIQILTNSNMK